jgi:DHA1 family tetracycline resistance protein-like MFS transporter
LLGLIVVRTLGGLMQGNIAIANADAADISSPERRAKRFGLLGAMMGVGFIVGPVVGGFDGGHQPASAFLFGGQLDLAEFALWLFCVARIAAVGQTQSLCPGATPTPSKP